MKRVLRLPYASLGLVLWFLALAPFAKGAGPHHYAGLPEFNGIYGGPLLVLTNETYTVGYSEFYKVPLWSAYKIHWVANATAPPRPDIDFPTDNRTQSKIKHDDYTQSDYFTNPKAFD